jgi:hypothetical protein
VWLEFRRVLFRSELVFTLGQLLHLCISDGLVLLDCDGNRFFVLDGDVDGIYVYDGDGDDERDSFSVINGLVSKLAVLAGD